MKKVFHPLAILLFFTLPMVVSMALHLATYRIINSLLEPGHLELWAMYGGALVLITLLFTTYAIYALLNGHKVHPYYAYALLLVGMAYLYFYFLEGEELLPWSIPRWMLVRGDVQLYMYTFWTPSLFHALLLLVFYFTPRREGHNPWKNLLLVVFIPLGWYTFMMVLVPLWQMFQFSEGVDKFSAHASRLFFVLSTIFFLFFLSRFLFILATRYSAFWSRYELLWKIPLAIVFPLLGLALNNTEFENIFGDFSHPAFYYLALANGVLLCLPNLPHTAYRFGLWIGRSILYAYILYFFLVFLPYLPLSIPAVIVFGCGFLMLTPLALAIVQAWTLHRDYQYLKERFPAFWLSILGAFAILALPLGLTYDYYQDRVALHKALDWVYESKYTLQTSEKISKRNINRVLQHIRSVKSSRRFWGPAYQRLPYLNPFYKWLVLDYLTLSDEKLHTLEQIFNGKSGPSTERFSRLAMPSSSDSVRVDSLYTHSHYDAKNQVWKTWVHTYLVNNDSLQREFTTRIALPAGLWVSNYYLDIEGRREYGLLAEKKAAQWVYRQIVGQRRDPGILYYEDARTLGWRIFPLEAGQTRTSGIEFTHIYPLEVTMGGRKITLGKPDTLRRESLVKTSGGHFIPNSYKKQLKAVQREPYFHLVVDASLRSKAKADFLHRQVDQFLKTHPGTSSKTKISFCNYRLQTQDLTNSWAENFRQFPKEGGFFAEYALKSILVEALENPKPHYPVVVFISDDWEKATFTERLTDFRSCIPESNRFWVWKEKEASVYTLSDPKKAQGSLLRQVRPEMEKVYPYPSAQDIQTYLPASQENEIFLPKQNPEQALSGINRENAFLLEAQVKRLQWHPEEGQSLWLSIVKNSFRTGLLTPHTTYLSLENEAQKEALKAKQKQILASKKSLDTGDELRRMSEPSWWMGLILVGILVFLFRKRIG